jgi:hypothetical protein
MQFLFLPANVTADCYLLRLIRSAGAVVGRCAVIDVVRSTARRRTLTRN